MANIATITGVELPNHMWPHIETRINDNSIRRYTTNTDGNYKYLAVSLTPKGIDGRIITVDRGIDMYDDMFGAGPAAIYGQAHLNARAAAQTGKVTLQVLRLTASDATYANVHVYAHYRITEPVVDPETDEIITPAKMQVMFTTKTSTLSDIEKLAESAPAASEVNAEVGPEWKTMRFISVAYVGKGTCGNRFSFRIANNSRSDKTSAYKNYYIDLFEGTKCVKQSTRVTLHPDAQVGSYSLFVEDVMNTQLYTSEDVCVFDVNPEVLNTLYLDYQTVVNPTTNLTIEQFDPITGVDKLLAKAQSSKYVSVSTNPNIAITNFEIVDDTNLHTVRFEHALGIKLSGGSDGAFDINNDPVLRQKAIDQRFIEAFEGKIDRTILSRYRCPLDFALDADFSTEVKVALAQFTGHPDSGMNGSNRFQDFRAYFDLGTDINTLEDPYEDSVAYDDSICTWTMSIDGYYGKIKDPVTKKVIRASSTYGLATALPLIWDKYGGKHVPYAGSQYGMITAYLPNSVYPVYDNTIDQKILDKLVDAHVNYACIDAKQNIIRGTQTTRYSGEEGENQFALGGDYVVSNLSEENNALIVLDVKKDVEKLITSYMYNFNETSEINSFNRDLSNLTSKYAAAQVRTIKAQFARTEEEAELGVLHLYIAIENKPLIKYLQVDIDVNRLGETA